MKYLDKKKTLRVIQKLFSPVFPVTSKRFTKHILVLIILRKQKVISHFASVIFRNSMINIFAIWMINDNSSCWVSATIDYLRKRVRAAKNTFLCLAYNSIHKAKTSRNLNLRCKRNENGWCNNLPNMINLSVASRNRCTTAVAFNDPMTISLAVSANKIQSYSSACAMSSYIITTICSSGIPWLWTTW